MIVYDKEQKEIVIPNGIGNINLFNNGVEAGYNQGKIDGIDEQKSKLESIIIVNNGTYRKEDGYNKIVVDVPDLNGSYEEGYYQGQADMAANARVLNVTENGVYRSKFSDDMPPIGYTVTGVYADGTEFYNFAELNGKIFNTKIAGSIDSRLEFWYKGDHTAATYGWDVIIGAGNNDNSNTFQVRYFININNKLNINIGNSDIVLDGWDDTVWHHFIVSKAEGLWIDGEKKCDFSSTNTVDGEFFINGINYDVKIYDGGTKNANGCFGMIKIDDTTIIPTANGFKNVNTGELLEVVKDGGYTFRENDPIYGEGELYKTINVNVPDLNGSYDEGYAQGKIDGINEQKAKLESINITENGTYRKEDGYNHIEVNVPDLNGSYDEGYEQGQADVAANARVLNVTENGNYLSRFSDPIIPTVTGVYADGTDFYSYAYLEGISYDSGFIVSEDMEVEIWWKGDVSKTDKNLFGSQVNNNNAIFKIRVPDTAYRFDAEIAMKAVTYLNAESDRWYHFKISYADGFWVDGVKIGDFSANISGTPDKLYINSNTPNTFNGVNGYFGMIKITTNGVENIITPTAEGLKNITTNEMLQVVQNGTYTFTENLPIYPEGELYKTINVNVIPKINVKETGLKFSRSTFKEVPEWADFEGITDMNHMFDACGDLQRIPFIDTSNVTDASNMLSYCSNLKILPNNLNLGNCTNMGSMLEGVAITDYTFLETWVINPNADMGSMITNGDTTYVPAIPCVGNTGYYQSAIFWGYGDFSKLTYFGGWIGRKYNVTQDYILKKMTALSYESCISILNNLYDFTGNGETPNSEQGQLKVAQSFIDTVGDKISIGTAKGWSISV